MEKSEPIRCRMVACPEALDDGKYWSFYLINDSDAALDLVVLYEIRYEWGNYVNCEAADVRVTGLAPGAHALLWREGGGGIEGRIEPSLRVRVRGREVRLQFEFPKLYLQRDLQVVGDLGKPGLQVAAEDRDG